MDQINELYDIVRKQEGTWTQEEKIRYNHLMGIQKGNAERVEKTRKFLIKKREEISEKYNKYGRQLESHKTVRASQEAKRIIGVDEKAVDEKSLDYYNVFDSYAKVDSFYKGVVNQILDGLKLNDEQKNQIRAIAQLGGLCEQVEIKNGKLVQTPDNLKKHEDNVGRLTTFFKGFSNADGIDVKSPEYKKLDKQLEKFYIESVTMSMEYKGGKIENYDAKELAALSYKLRIGGYRYVRPIFETAVGKLWLTQHEISDDMLQFCEKLNAGVGDIVEKLTSAQLNAKGLYIGNGQENGKDFIVKDYAKTKEAIGLTNEAEANDVDLQIEEVESKYSKLMNSQNPLEQVQRGLLEKQDKALTLGDLKDMYGKYQYKTQIVKDITTKIGNITDDHFHPTTEKYGYFAQIEEYVKLSDEYLKIRNNEEYNKLSESQKADLAAAEARLEALKVILCQNISQSENGVADEAIESSEKATIANLIPSTIEEWQDSIIFKRYKAIDLIEKLKDCDKKTTVCISENELDEYKCKNSKNYGKLYNRFIESYTPYFLDENGNIDESKKSEAAQLLDKALGAKEQQELADVVSEHINKMSDFFADHLQKVFAKLGIKMDANERVVGEPVVEDQAFSDNLQAIYNLMGTSANLSTILGWRKDVDKPNMITNNGAAYNNEILKLLHYDDVKMKRLDYYFNLLNEYVYTQFNIFCRKQSVELGTKSFISGMVANSPNEVMVREGMKAICKQETNTSYDNYQKEKSDKAFQEYFKSEEEINKKQSIYNENMKYEKEYGDRLLASIKGNVKEDLQNFKDESGYVGKNKDLITETGYIYSKCNDDFQNIKTLYSGYILDKKLAASGHARFDYLALISRVRVENGEVVKADEEIHKKNCAIIDAFFDKDKERGYQMIKPHLEQALLKIFNVKNFSVDFEKLNKKEHSFKDFYSNIQITELGNKMADYVYTSEVGAGLNALITKGTMGNRLLMEMGMEKPEDFHFFEELGKMHGALTVLTNNSANYQGVGMNATKYYNYLIGDEKSDEELKEDENEYKDKVIGFQLDVERCQELAKTNKFAKAILDSTKMDRADYSLKDVMSIYKSTKSDFEKYLEPGVHPFKDDFDEVDARREAIDKLE